MSHFENWIDSTVARFYRVASKSGVMPQSSVFRSGWVEVAVSLVIGKGISHY